ncbi:MAG: ComF family protein [Bacteroidetes bacterium]|nr:ComF family protein [Bacteroidota bacterium]MBS1648461.1 ComF family protein [Bacteroidota bacterium]
MQSYIKDFTHLIFPHHCEGCGTDVLNNDDLLCAKCLHELPATNYFFSSNNPVEKTFYGRCNITSAASAFYFTKNSLLQHLLIQLKYKGNKEVGYFLGKLMGLQIQQSGRFNCIDALIPLPLNPKKESKRGYNQAALLCEGIAEVLKISVVYNAVERVVFTETQTKQNRIHRWQNMENVFAIKDITSIQNKHILLVDDVITTGATLEACANSILQKSNAKVSIATAAYTI